MSRLPAPGFSSKLKVPGFTKPQSVDAACEVPLPEDKVHDEQTFKEPKVTQPRIIPTGGLRPPSSRLQKSQQSNTLHGPSPYNRIKPPNHSIPYVGKKRTTGTLKAPEGRGAVTSSKDLNSTQVIDTIHAAVSNKSVDKTQSTMGNSIAKPVKRQLIPPGATNKSKLAQPRGVIARPVSTTGIHPSKSKSDNTSIATKRTISRSLQSLPQQSTKQNRSTNTSKGNLTKSFSSDALANISKNTTAKSKAKSTNALKPPAPISRFKKPALIRPRSSSHKPKQDTFNNISTPCQTGQNGKKLNKLKISPIVNNSVTQDSLDQSGLPNLDASSQSVLSPDDSLGVVPNEIVDDGDEDNNTTATLSFNSTYSKLDIFAAKQNETHLVNNPNRIAVFSNNEENNNVDNLHDLNQTHLVPGTNFQGNVTQVLPTNDQLTVTRNINPIADESANFLNQTRVIEPVSKNVLNATHVIPKNDDKTIGIPDETDFLENLSMPLCDDTPQKTDLSLNETQENNSSFTDDILKVIAAISSQVNTQPMPSVVMTTSPMKQFQTEHVLHHEVIQNGTFISLIGNKSNAFSEASTIKNDDTLDSSVLQELEIDTTPKAKSHSIINYPSAPTTPKNDEEENFFSITNRCYTVSAAELRRNKVSRRNTFQAHDSSRFRAPKEMNTLETLEGNILMDNTSFLQLSNDTRAIKTMLLKLKRTLLEVDCPSPLVKAPLKRSNSCAVRRTDDPPLSPRITQSSPMAVVDPFSSTTTTNTIVPTEDGNGEEITTTKPKGEENQLAEKTDSISSLSGKFQESLRRIEELEKESECQKYTIKLLQTQMEQTEQKEQDMLEENIILREEVNHLTERLQRILSKNGTRERNLSSSGSYMEEFDLADTECRRGILERMYSTEANNES